MKYSIIPVLAFATMAFAVPTTLEARDDAPEINEALNTQDPPQFKWPDNLHCNAQYENSKGADRDRILDAYQAMLGDKHTITSTVNKEKKNWITPGPGQCSDTIEGSNGMEVIVCNDDTHNNLVLSRDQLAKYVQAIYQWCSGDPALQAKTASKNSVSGQYFVVEGDYNFNVVVHGGVST